MTSHPARLSLRAPPHLPFIQGFPGIPGDKERRQPAICGTVEVRVGVQPIKAKWVRVEIRKHESLPPGFPGSGDTWELVGEINTLWQSQGKEFDLLQTADFKFFLPLPETMPPTVEMMKGTGVWYELVAALSYRKKGGIFKSDSANIMKVTEPIRITKHELHSVWPVYNNPDQKTVVGQDLSMTIQRPGVAFGPGDRILLTAALKSNRPTPFKLRGFECTLLEVVTSIPDPKKKAQPIVKSRPIAQARCAVDESLGRGGEKSARIDMAAPADLLVTVRHAKTLEVGYELQVKAVCDGFEGPVVPGIKYVVGPYTKGSAQQAVKDIGYVEQLCGPKPAQTLSPSPDPRRQSTSTITSATTERLADFSPVPSRPYSTVPNRQPLAFPTAHPAPALTRSPSTTISDYSQPETSEAHNRYSTATFGNWNKALQTNATASPEMKNTWDSAEREKMALYNSARANAASTQQSAGIPLEQLGMADIPDTAPPEYAPPLPTLPGTYQAPTRPVSAYTSPDPSSSSLLSSPDLTTPEAGPSIVVTPSIPGPSRTDHNTAPVGLSEKEQMRRYYEARDQVSARDGSPSVIQHPILAALPQDPLGPSTSSIQPDTGLTEKEQMRRYYEARDRVQAVADGSAAPSGSGSAVLSQYAAPPAESSSNANTHGAGLSEKEQMRRYYEARDRVQAVAEGSAGPSASEATALSPLSAYSTETPTKGNAEGSGLSEKEQMRRYYEARDRVQAASDSPKASGSGSTSVPPAAYSSADNEKETMRKRYEAATSQIELNSPIPPTSIPTFSPTRTISTPPPSMTSTLPPPVSESSGSGTTPAYPSATDEKERMRKLYEEANQRVRARASLSPPPQSPGPSSSSTVPLSPPVDQPTPFNPCPDRSGLVQTPFTPPAPDSLAGSRLARNDAEEVPPPLPSRPPADYINLLSPVSDIPPAGFNRA